MVMDVLRTSYKKSANYFLDSNIDATIVWYKAPLGAKIFPGPHKWGSLFWYKFPWEASGVGENYDSGYTYSKGATPPTAFGRHYFGPLEYFREGCPYDPTNVTVRDAYGLAVACAQPDDPIPCHGCNVPSVLHGHFAALGPYPSFDVTFHHRTLPVAGWFSGDAGQPFPDDGLGFELFCDINGLSINTYVVATGAFIPGTFSYLAVICSPFSATGTAVIGFFVIKHYAVTITEQP